VLTYRVGAVRRWRRRAPPPTVPTAGTPGTPKWVARTPATSSGCYRSTVGPIQKQQIGRCNIIDSSAACTQLPRPICATIYLRGERSVTSTAFDRLRWSDRHQRGPAVRILQPSINDDRNRMLARGRRCLTGERPKPAEILESSMVEQCPWGLEATTALPAAYPDDLTPV
jgi:hypothetical protein